MGFNDERGQGFDMVSFLSGTVLGVLGCIFGVWLAR